MGAVTAPMTPSRLANVGARAAVHAFSHYQDRFRAITGRARGRFEQRDWHGVQADMVERLDLYRDVIDEVTAEMRSLLGDHVEDTVTWASLKAVFSGLIADRGDWEIAETFFNSVTRRIFATVGVDHRIEFVATDFDSPPTRAPRPLFYRYKSTGSIEELIEAILTDFRFDVLYEDLRRDAKLAAAALERHLQQRVLPLDMDGAEVVRQPFYRGQGAYLIGRLVTESGYVPLVIALRNPADAVVVDAVLMDEDDVSVLFSFTRSYFHVDIERPYDLVQFLSTLMPGKRTAELYTAIGLHKHGKTELYRELLAHVAAADDHFEIAWGDPGLVMAVFTMPGFDFVFKVLRDTFGAPKQITRGRVMDKYRLVFHHDRAGRLIDAQPFEHLQFDRSRFAPDLLEELVRECSRTVEVEDDTVVVHHAYVERRVRPLNLHVRRADSAEAERAVIDYGYAIKDLAASNIFPGDMLLKNFGVTRHGRVVFYDYDELALLTSCSFREMPDTDHYDDALSDEPWYGVGEGDIFPEEFRSFLGMPAPLRAAFEYRHNDLFDPSFWRGYQERIEAGEIIEIFPYQPDRRLHPSSVE